jgi:hypothetical protein
MNKNKIADAFNKCFLSIADSVTPDTNGHTSTGTANPVAYLADVLLNELAVCSMENYKITKDQRLFWVR